MKTIALQLVTVDLEDGGQGVFVGCPLIADRDTEPDTQISDVWFSNIQEVPEHLTVGQLIELMKKQICACHSLH